MVRLIFALLGCSIVASVLLAFLYIQRPIPKNLKYGGFDRVFRWDIPDFADSLVLPNNHFYIAGHRDGHLFLGNRRIPMRLWRLGPTLRDTVNFGLYASDPFAYKNLSAHVQDSGFHLLDGNQPAVFSGGRGSWTAARWQRSDHFIQAVPISSGNIAILNYVGGMNTLGSMRRDGDRPQWNQGLLEPQFDGFFCTFGQLLGDPTTGHLVYVYLYRNQYLLLDSNLNLVYRGTTLDTINQAKINPSKTDRGVTMASPPMAVNLRSSIANGRLYIHGNVMSDNQTKAMFQSHATIDVYNLYPSSRYLFSIYLPLNDWGSIREFTVIGNELFVLQGNLLVSYLI